MHATLDIYGWYGKRKSIPAAEASAGLRLATGETYMIVTR
jgi:hypothetical protein